MGQEQHASASQQPPADDADHDKTPRPPPRAAKRHIRWRPSVWLTTLSTVVAVATGMFTLRGQIFPSSGGSADASVSGYQVAVGNVCSGLLEADNVAASNDNAAYTQNGETALAQRNTEINLFNSALRSSESLLAQFEGLTVPRRLSALERSAAGAWNHIVTGQRAFVERLDAVHNEQALGTANGYFPALNDALDSDDLARAINLAKLNAGRCVLSSTLPAAATPAGGGLSKTFPTSLSGAASLPFTDGPTPVL